jgi:hypothetical protein
MRMRRDLWSVSWPALHHVSTLSYKSHDFRGKKYFEYKMCVMIFSIKFNINMSHSKNNRDKCDRKCTFWSSCELSGYSCATFTKPEFSPHIFKKYSGIKINDDLSSGSWVAIYGKKDEQTDMTKLIFAFRQFSETPQNLNTENGTTVT